MPLILHLNDLEKGPVSLQGELTAADLDLVNVDELVRISAPVQFRLQAQLLDDEVLVEGKVKAPLECECSRCLKPYPAEVNLGNWAWLVPLKGEDKVELEGDCVDLTPQLREDILLVLPQHPLCRPECSGLPFTAPNQEKQGRSSPREEANSSIWAELNKLKLEK